jgi:hypothetical protein
MIMSGLSVWRQDRPETQAFELNHSMNISLRIVWALSFHAHERLVRVMARWGHAHPSLSFEAMLFQKLHAQRHHKQASM